jgi:hypothetical protein
VLCIAKEKHDMNRQQVIETLTAYNQANDLIAELCDSEESPLGYVRELTESGDCADVEMLVQLDLVVYARSRKGLSIKFTDAELDAIAGVA